MSSQCWIIYAHVSNCIFVYIFLVNNVGMSYPHPEYFVEIPNRTEVGIFLLFETSCCHCLKLISFEHIIYSILKMQISLMTK